MTKKGGNSGRKARTLLQKEYDRKYRNLEKRVESALKRGYSWERPLLTEKPKKITQKSLQALENKNKTFYEKARYTDPETGKETSGKRGREIERSRAGKKAAETRKKKEPPPVEDAVLRAIIDFINNFVPIPIRRPSPMEQDNRANALETLLLDVIYRDGWDEVAKRCEANAGRIWDLIEKYIYSSRDTSAYIWSQLSAIIEDKILDYEEDDSAYGMDEDLDTGVDEDY